MSLGCTYFRVCDRCKATTPQFDKSGAALRYAKRAGWRKWKRYYKGEVCAACIAAGRIPTAEVIWLPVDDQPHDDGRT